MNSFAWNFYHLFANFGYIIVKLLTYSIDPYPLVTNTIGIPFYTIGAINEGSTQNVVSKQDYSVIG